MSMELLPVFFLLLLIGATAVASSEPAYPGYGADAEPTCSLKGEAAVAPVAVPDRREEFDGGRILDISHYYREDMPAFESAEGTPGFLRLARSMRNGSDIANFSELRLTAHSGTHVDAPGHVFEHYYDAGFDVDTLDLAVLNGPALLVDVPRNSNITADIMKSLHIPKGVRRVLFRTLNTDRKLMWKKEFDASYVGFMEDGAQWLIDNTDIQLVGVDYLSVGAYEECIPAHLVFLEKRALAWKMPVLHLQGKTGEKERLIPHAFLGGRARGANGQLLHDLFLSIFYINERLLQSLPSLLAHFFFFYEYNGAVRMGVGAGPPSRCRSTGATMSVTHQPPASRSSNGSCRCCCINIYVNNNVQGVTNSVLFGSSVAMRDPGARVVSARRPPRGVRFGRRKQQQQQRQKKKKIKTMMWAATAMVCLAIVALVLGLKSVCK